MKARILKEVRASGFLDLSERKTIEEKLEAYSQERESAL
jgi:hypothetical protein